MKITDETRNTAKELSVVDAKYLDGFRLRVSFNDGATKVLDLRAFLESSRHPAIRRYLDKKLFRKFQIVGGNLNWNDYDLVFPISDLYRGKIS